MKYLKRTLWAFAILALLLLLAITAYGMGRDIVSVVPAWLVSFGIGIVMMTISGIILFIFVMGIVYIRNWFKE